MRKTRLKAVIFMALASMAFSISASAEWKKESDKWSWVENQQKITGWKEIDSKWYYFDENGVMQSSK